MTLHESVFEILALMFDEPTEHIEKATALIVDKVVDLYGPPF